MAKLIVQYLCVEESPNELYCALQFYHIIRQGSEGVFFEELSPSSIDGTVATKLENTNIQQYDNPAVFALQNL